MKERKKYTEKTMEAAPQDAFMQSSLNKPLINKFVIGQKLEAKDARNTSAISVATVMDIRGPRIRLRLDGTDGLNDFWRLTNSKDIFPLGTCEAHGGLLQPPLGFIRNVSTWQSFIQKRLQNADRADESCFLEEPGRPPKNLFQIGQRLEAIDRKNPELICPAVIGDVQGDQIFVTFDGWRGSMDYWCDFDSRDVFPVGWCNAHNYFLQPAGVKGDNPQVAEQIKEALELRKRRTRSTKPIGLVNRGQTPARGKPTQRRHLPKNNSYLTTSHNRSANQETQDTLPSETCLNSSMNGKSKDDVISSFESSGDQPPSNESHLKSCEVGAKSCDVEKKDSSASQVMTPPNEVGIRSINKAEVPVTSQDKNDAISEDQTDPTCEDIQLKLVSVKEARIKADKMMKNEKLKPPSSTEDIEVSEDSSSSTITMETKRKSKPKLSPTSLAHAPLEVSKYQEELKKAERYRRKWHKQQRRVAKSLQRCYNNDAVDAADPNNCSMIGQNSAMPVATISRKRNVSLSDCDVIKSGHKKKKKKKKSATFQRMDGFGKSRTSEGVVNTLSTSIITSLHKSKPLPSLFGSMNQQHSPATKLNSNSILRSATTGWPTRLSMGSVVTSDNKLGRFNLTGSEPVNKTFTTSDSRQSTSTTMINSRQRPTCSLEVPSSSLPGDVSSTTCNSLNQQTFRQKNSPGRNSELTSRPKNLKTTEKQNPTLNVADTTTCVTNQSKVGNSARKRSRNPKKWTIEEVCGYVTEHEPALQPHINLLHKHEIDGMALLLIDNVNVKYMGLKLGPALKLCRVVSALNSTLQQRRSKSNQDAN